MGCTGPATRPRATQIGNFASCIHCVRTLGSVRRMKSARFAIPLCLLAAAPQLHSAAAPATPLPKNSAPATAKEAKVDLSSKVDASDLEGLRNKAERGNAIAQYNLGLAYAQGRQTPA